MQEEKEKMVKTNRESVNKMEAQIKNLERKREEGRLEIAALKEELKEKDGGVKTLIHQMDQLTEEMNELEDKHQMSRLDSLKEAAEMKEEIESLNKKLLEASCDKSLLQEKVDGLAKELHDGLKWGTWGINFVYTVNFPNRHMAWGVRRGRRRPQACQDRRNFRESMATPCHTPIWP
jgi:predicted RNase H-like nuclease (RuvC/YqgF family)